MTFKVKQKKSRQRKTFAVCRGRITYDVFINKQKVLNFETKKDAELWIEESKRKQYGWFKEGKPNVVIRQRVSQPYKLGEMWRDDFDYIGMVKTGSEAKTNLGIQKLNKLFDSYEDVNYHSESEHLYSAIENLKAGKKKEAEKDMIKFRNVNKSLLRRWGR